MAFSRTCELLMVSILLLAISIGVVSADASVPIEWVRCIGGSSGEDGHSVQQTADGGYIVTGATESHDGDFISAGTHSGADAYVAKVSQAGSVEWARCIGGSGNDHGECVEELADGGFILAGTARSSNGNFTDAGYQGGTSDAFVARLNSTGMVLWVRCVGGSGDECGWAVQHTMDGGFILVGQTDSTDGDFAISGYRGGVSDAFMAKLNSTGNVQWAICIGGSSYDYSYAVNQTSDGGYIVAGATGSLDGDFVSAGKHTGPDAFTAKVTSTGTIEWANCIGGSQGDSGNSVQQTTDGGFILAGETTSMDGDFADAGSHSLVVILMFSLPNLMQLVIESGLCVLAGIIVNGQSQSCRRLTGVLLSQDSLTHQMGTLPMRETRKGKMLSSQRPLPAAAM